MSQSKERLLELNARLAQNLTDKGVEATADETTTELVNKVAEISREDTLLKRIKNELSEFYTDEAISIPTHLFSGCSNLIKFATPNATGGTGSAGTYAFYGCSDIKYIDIGKTPQYYNAMAAGCHKIKTIILRANSVVTLPSIFSNNNSITNGTCYFYVPKELVEDYKQATNWSVYANQIRAIEDYPEEVNYDNY